MVEKKSLKKYVVFVVTAMAAAGLVLLSTQIGQKRYYPFEDDQRMQILFLGDSNFAYDFGDKTIPQRIGEELDANVFNAAIGGTAAAKLNDDNYIDSQLDLFGLYNLSKVMVNGDEQSLYEYYNQGGGFAKDAFGKAEMISNIKLEELDYIVISYGLNDYTTGCAIYGEDPYDEETYSGALKTSVERIQKACPNATIILSSITYCIFYGNNIETQDGYEKDYGGGTINDYRDAMESIAAEYENVYFIDNLERLDIDKSNYEQYLNDEMHLSVEGHHMYVDSFLNKLEEIESIKNEQNVD